MTYLFLDLMRELNNHPLTFACLRAFYAYFGLRVTRADMRHDKNSWLFCYLIRGDVDTSRDFSDNRKAGTSIREGQNRLPIAAIGYIANFPTHQISPVIHAAVRQNATSPLFCLLPTMETMLFNTLFTATPFLWLHNCFCIGSRLTRLFRPFMGFNSLTTF